ncbi:MAG: thioredoxin-dependent thiol peroxidase [Alistipes sp.]|nr:thioredoxin-dependent thiol peroxidase [Alistipes sp.]
MLKVGDKAPLFEGVTQSGESVKLADFAGKKLILYFYPKDNTSGCTLEAKSLRDGKESLKADGFEIVGVSPDSVKSHQNFCTKHELNFTLIADTDKSIAEAYDVWKEKSMYGRKYMGIVRTTFVIDEQGVIIHIFDKVRTSDHWVQIAEWWKSYGK